VGILMPFLGFSMAYNHSKAHNMLVIMLDLHYKNMKCIHKFVDNWYKKWNVFKTLWEIQFLLKLLQNMMLRLCVLYCKCRIISFMLGNQHNYWQLNTMTSSFNKLCLLMMYSFQIWKMSYNYFNSYICD
jgi:hypothetical protein